MPAIVNHLSTRENCNGVSPVVEEDYWDLCKKRLEQRLPASFFHSFIQPIQGLNAPSLKQGEKGGEHLQIAVGDERLYRHIEARYLPLIEESLREVAFHGQVSFLLRNKNEIEVPASDTPIGLLNSRNIVGSSVPMQKNPFAQTRTCFYPHHANKEDVAKLLELDFPSSTAFVFGPSGSGKTHLAQELVGRFGEDALYYTLEGFLSEFFVSCNKKNTLPWRTRFRDNRVIVIDDFQFLKPTAKKTQEELRNVIDDFERNGKKLILCSDTDLNSLSLQSDLRSRLYLTFGVKLFYADREGRSAIFRNDLRSLGLNVSEDLISYFSGKVSGDVRRLKSVVARLRYFPHLSVDGKIDYEQIDSQFGDIYDARTSIPPEKILDKVSAFFRVSVADITGPVRDKHFALARHLVAYLCTEGTSLRFEDIASVIGRKKHGSVIHARNKIERMMESDLFFKKQVQTLLAELYSENM